MIFTKSIKKYHRDFLYISSGYTEFYIVKFICPILPKMKKIAEIVISKHEMPIGRLGSETQRDTLHWKISY